MNCFLIAIWNKERRKDWQDRILQMQSENAFMSEEWAVVDSEGNVVEEAAYARTRRPEGAAEAKADTGSPEPAPGPSEADHRLNELRLEAEARAEAEKLTKEKAEVARLEELRIRLDELRAVEQRIADEKRKLEALQQEDKRRNEESKRAEEKRLAEETAARIAEEQRNKQPPTGYDRIAEIRRIAEEQKRQAQIDEQRRMQAALDLSGQQTEGAEQRQMEQAMKESAELAEIQRLAREFDMESMQRLDEPPAAVSGAGVQPPVPVDGVERSPPPVGAPVPPAPAVTCKCLGASSGYHRADCQRT